MQIAKNVHAKGGASRMPDGNVQAIIRDVIEGPLSEKSNGWLNQGA